MPRAWDELPADTGWGDIRVVRTHLEKQGYVIAELRGSGNVMLRLSAYPLERGEVLRVPGQR